MEYVILVDEHDAPLGLMEKLKAHEQGALHRAISVLIFNAESELLIQRRALGKYHSPGLWTNSCCSHPRDGEEVLAAGERRLMEEMGMKATLQPLFHFRYRAEFDNGLIEHELDHVLVGRSNELPALNREEAMDFEWMSLDTVRQEIERKPSQFTPWFILLIQNHFEELNRYACELQ
ncbi:MAG: Isopentenyl-diphosphate Delta-isomerase [Flavobacteriia bacterium]|nr:MAG: Isopentenyl-diphosphate Delta-isomerase [Flavobacteriia bacterium]